MTDPSGTRPGAQPDPTQPDPTQPDSTQPDSTPPAPPGAPAVPSSGYAGHPAPPRRGLTRRLSRRPLLAGALGAVLVALIAFTGGVAVGRATGDDAGGPTSVRDGGVRDGLGPRGDVEREDDGDGMRGRLPGQPGSGDERRPDVDPGPGADA
ncbi:hypothetical protein [Pengzhenrongella sicca]|uniref:Uncharacterized protein n=1 Tax=Pengzhenrongella sicca TaxID=2819238 RepID=A0A8A4ZCU5_9MICO|nr:hypothetical protein [Pengzhenrongella sicca]QTE29724.1 hypothetical protein J4E96_01325 [Pengzhenrongella sicca]